MVCGVTWDKYNFRKQLVTYAGAAVICSPGAVTMAEMQLLRKAMTSLTYWSRHFTMNC